MTKLTQAIEKTLAYSRRYGGKLTLTQLEQRLLSARVYSREKINLAIKPEVLRGENDEIRFNDDKIKYAIKTLWELKKWKNILMIGITGSVAAENAKRDDDIDILVVVKNNTLWTTRLLLKLWLRRHKIKHRHYDQREQKDSLCFNLWLDEFSLIISKKRQILPNAVDLIMMKVIFEKDGCYYNFLKANDWVKKYVATGYRKKMSNVQCPMSNNKEENNMFNKMINWICYLGQRAYMRGRIGKGEVGIHKAYFYP